MDGVEILFGIAIDVEAFGYGIGYLALELEGMAGHDMLGSEGGHSCLTSHFRSI